MQRPLLLIMLSQLAVTSSGLARSLRTGDWLDRPRLLGYAAILGTFEIALAAFWALGASSGIDPLGKPLGTDFISFWSASRLALAGTPALAYDPAAHGALEAAQFGSAAGYFAFFYPPVFLLICLPLALLPYALSLTVWLVATAMPYLAALRRLLPALKPADYVACLAFPAILLNIGHGQNGLLAAGLMALGFINLDRRPWFGGLFLGALVFKPQLAILIPFVLAFSGRWRAFAAAAVSALLLSTASWLILGSSTWSAFASELFLASRTLSDSFVEPAKMISIFAAARLLAAPAPLALVLQMAAAFTVVVVVARFARRAAPPMLAALSVTGTLLATPFALDYDLTLLAIPLAVLFGAGRAGGFMPYEKLLLAAGFILPLAVRPLAIGLHLPVAPLVVLGLFWIIAGRLASHRDAGATPSSA